MNYGEEFKTSPPMIDVSKISDSIPIALFVGDKDDLATVYDNDWLFEELGGNNTVFSYEILPDFGHSTFNFGKNKTFLNTIADQLEQYNPLPESLKLQFGNGTSE
jgi:alpha-beta hydrolase superfamily lysophospholipase